MNVLVTGGLGFIGSKVVLQLLKRNISVIIADLDIKKNKSKLEQNIEKIGKDKNLIKYENNTRLSAARAISVASMIEKKLNTLNNIIGIRAYGSNRPLKPNISDLYRALNRRVVIIIKKDREKENTKNNNKVNENTLSKN